MNNLGGTQWRPMQPSQGDFGSAFQPLPPQTRRQITKNPHNMYQNFPNNQQHQLGGFGGGGNSQSNGFSGPISPTGMSSSASTGRLGRLMSPNGVGQNGGINGLDIGFDLQSEPQRVSPGFGGLNMRNNMMSPSNGSGGLQRGGMSNGFNDLPRHGMTTNGFGLDRSISSVETNLFDQFNKLHNGRDNTSGNSSSLFGRQTSVPSSMDGIGNGMRSNGFGGSSGGNGGNGGNGGGSSDFGRFRSDSPPFQSNGGPFKDMQIGTWDSGNNDSGSRPNAANGSSYFEIGTFNVPTAQNNYSSSSAEQPQRGVFHNPISSAATSGGGPGIRETGIIEKLLHSYGFIQCCDRQARLFFHFSQFDGTIEHLKIGDPVEFEVTYDRRTGKPIASNVSKIAPEVVMSEERVIGTVTTEPRVDSETRQETAGRISYENGGECFFLPFNTSDVEGNVIVKAGDKCSFQMATMARSGNLVARTIRLENPVAPVKYQGVINSIKDKTCGTIERSDVVREIYFHFGDVKEEESVDLGDDVEFTIQTREGKEVASNITSLPRGTVVFEDVGAEYFTGQVLKPLDRHLKQPSGEGEALSGRIKYRDVDRSEVEVLFGEKDQVGDFTLRHGDWVKFVIAIDRRDKLKRATRIELLDQSFNVSDERREQGKVTTISDGIGLIKCATRDAELFFHACECLDVKRKIEIGDECEFTASEDPAQSSGRVAIRIKHLPSGTVEFDVVIHKDVIGKVEVEPSRSKPSSPAKNGCSESIKANEEAGTVVYELNGNTNLEIPVFASDCEHRIRKDDVIRFDINQCRATKSTNAVNIRIMDSPGAIKEAAAKRDTDVRELRRGNRQGYIAALRDGFGFVETLTREKEIFFHFSNVEGKPDKLEVGMEVEYTIFNREKGGKVSAEGVKVLNKGTIPPLKAKDGVMNGKVVRPLRSVNPDREEYCGLIQVKSEEGKVLAQYEFGIASLLNKKELLQVGDPVQFQVHLAEEFAVNIQATREKLRSNVEAMKGQFGFLSYEVEEGKKLFFHTSEVEGQELLQQGDEVEFVVVTNKRTGKHSACCVRKLSSSKRPERLISKLKTMNLEDAARGGKKMVVVRQPRGPEVGQSFKAPRNV